MKNKTLLLLFCIIFSLSSCMTLSHDVGKGAQGNVTYTKRQVYLLWGLIPIGNVDTQKMAKGATDYTIESKINFLDFLIAIPGSIITLKTQTVKVTH